MDSYLLEIKTTDNINELYMKFLLKDAEGRTALMTIPKIDVSCFSMGSIFINNVSLEKIYKIDFKKTLEFDKQGFIFKRIDNKEFDRLKENLEMRYNKHDSWLD